MINHGYRPYHKPDRNEINEVLDKVRTEIQTEHDDVHSECKYEDGWSDALEWVLEIIDKYRNEVSG